MLRWVLVDEVAGGEGGGPVGGVGVVGCFDGLGGGVGGGHY